MRKLSLLFAWLVLAIAFVSCGGNDQKEAPAATAQPGDTTAKTTIQWLDSIVDVGTIKPGDKADIKFRFKNIGTKPLLILSARPGCGCTIADFPKEPLAPGAQGVISAVFDSKNKPEEAFHKNIMVMANTEPDTHYLYFKGDISTRPPSVSPANDTSAKVKYINPKDLILVPTKK